MPRMHPVPAHRPPLSCEDTVQASDVDNDGIAVGALVLGGGRITNGGGQDAVLTLNSVGSTTGVKVGALTITLAPATLPAGTAGAAYSQTLDGYGRHGAVYLRGDRGRVAGGADDEQCRRVVRYADGGRYVQSCRDGD